MVPAGVGSEVARAGVRESESPDQPMQVPAYACDVTEPLTSWVALLRHLRKLRDRSCPIAIVVAQGNGDDGWASYHEPVNQR